MENLGTTVVVAAVLVLVIAAAVSLAGMFLMGALARWILPGKDPMGFWMTVLVGFAGGVLGNLFAGLLRVYPDQNPVISWLLSLVGGVGVVLFIRWWRTRGTTRPA